MMIECDPPPLEEENAVGRKRGLVGAARLPLPAGERVAAKRPGEGADPTKRRAGATTRARKLRAEDTEPEYRLWSDLRGRRLNGFKFVRQIPLGPYIVDFLCRDQKLVVELDGAQHSGSASDVARTRWLNRSGYSVIRFWNDEVLRERTAVLETILAVLEGKLVAPSPDLRFAPATLSPRGRGRQSPDDAPFDRNVLADAGSLRPLPAGERVAAKRPGEEAGIEPKPIAQPRFKARLAQREEDPR